MFNKNTILSTLIIGSLLFLFFNEYGIVSLMKKQSVNNKLKKELKNILNDKKRLQIENKKIHNYNNEELDDLQKKELDDLRKKHGITFPNEYFYIVEPK